MKKLLTIAAAAAALALGATGAQAETRQERNEARLAQMLEGRTAGEPTSCITVLRSSDVQILAYIGVVYESGDTVWVARARDPNMLRSDDIPIFERISNSRLCTSDAMRTVDRNGQFITGALFLDDFIPYTRTED